MHVKCAWRFPPTSDCNSYIYFSTIISVKFDHKASRKRLCSGILYLPFTSSRVSTNSCHNYFIFSMSSLLLC